MPIQRQNLSYKKKFGVSLPSLLMATAMMGQALSGPIDYRWYGANWPALNIPNNDCGKSNQSPIDLSYTKFKNITNDADTFFKHYEDVEKTKIKWDNNKYSTYVDLPAKQKVTGFSDNYFTSSYSKLKQEFKAIGFHFHAKSEHTIEGK